jgi:O-antigen/teichoic acid export membrane protein
MEKVANIAKNTSYFTAALIIQKVISFTYFTILARNLIPDDLGKYYFAISFTTIFAIFIDLGLANVLTREVAKAGKGSDITPQKLLSLAMAVKLPLALLSTLAVVILINVLGYPSLTRLLVYISSLSMVLDSFALAFFSVIRGFHNLKYESIASVIFQLIALVVGVIALKLDLGLPVVISAFALGSLFSFTFSLLLLKIKWRMTLKPLYDRAAIKWLAALTLPFALYAVFQRLYTYLDTVFLSLLSDDRQVGLYQIAFKIILAFQFLPMAFSASLYPAFASYWQQKKNPPRADAIGSPLPQEGTQLEITFERAMKYLMIISIPISAGIIILSDQIILLFRPEYDAAVPALRLAMVSLVFLFLNFPPGALLNACDRQKINTRNMGITLAVSVILNIILIPQFQAVGASLTLVISSFVLFALNFFAARLIIKQKLKSVLLSFLKVFLATTVMGILLYALKNNLNVFINVIMGAIVYFIALYIFKGFKKEDVASILSSFINRVDAGAKR